MVTRKSTGAAAGPRALSLHIGLNSVNPAHYAGWSGDLAACEFDADDMAAIAVSRKMKPTVLMTKKATRAAVLASIRAAAGALKSGDFYFLTFSGHGGQVPDPTGDDEADKLDETWCLYDAQLIDDELYVELSRFRAGVRILVFSDSCHSGTVVRALPPLPGATTRAERPRLMPPAVGLRVYRNNQEFYDKLQSEIAATVGKSSIVDPDAALAQVAVSGRLTAIVKEFKPSVILISGCQDNQVSMDGQFNGAFTERLLMVWRNGQFKGNYGSLHMRTRALLPPTQSPNLYTLGSAAAFLKQQAFSV